MVAFKSRSSALVFAEKKSRSAHLSLLRLQAQTLLERAAFTGNIDTWKIVMGAVEHRDQPKEVKEVQYHTLKLKANAETGFALLQYLSISPETTYLIFCRQGKESRLSEHMLAKSSPVQR